MQSQDVEQLDLTAIWLPWYEEVHLHVHLFTPEVSESLSAFVDVIWVQIIGDP